MSDGSRALAVAFLATLLVGMFCACVYDTLKEIL